MIGRPINAARAVTAIGLEFCLLAMCSTGAMVRGSAQRASIDASATQAASERKPYSDIVGLWQAPLLTPQRTLRIVIKLLINPGGDIRGTLDSPDQGLQGLPLEKITFQSDVLAFDFPAGQAHYEGHLTRHPDKIEGTWSQAGRTASLTFERIEQVPAMVDRPQTPHPPYPYKTEQVSYSNDEANIRIAGTLTTPSGPGPFPAALLLTIAGPEDRDETNGTHKHFLVLADYLTRHGIAVLRSDNRGVGESTGDYYKATIHDRAEDALAALRFLKSRAEVDSKRIGLIGNSEGGEVASLAASRSSEVAFVVMLAAPGLAGAELIRNQTESLATLQGYSAEQKRIVLERAEAIFVILGEETNNEKAITRLKELAKGSRIPTPKVANLAASNSLEAELLMYVSPWYRDMIVYDPRPTLALVRCPVLAINGGSDVVVEPHKNLTELQRALVQGRNPDYTVMQLPGLNHLFQTAQTGSPSEYGLIEESFAPLALRIVSDWIRQRFRSDVP
jgi:uncharacterized protein